MRCRYGVLLAAFAGLVAVGLSACAVSETVVVDTSNGKSVAVEQSEDAGESVQPQSAETDGTPAEPAEDVALNNKAEDPSQTSEAGEPGETSEPIESGEASESNEQAELDLSQEEGWLQGASYQESTSPSEEVAFDDEPAAEESSAESGPATQVPQESPDPYVSTTPRDPAELEALADLGIELSVWRTGQNPLLDEGELINMVAGAFSDANRAYKKGQYDTATYMYEQILETYPLHFGANINLTLAYLNLSRNEDALVQALSCAILFPKEPGTVLNAQAAATACGFGEADIEVYLRDLLNYGQGTGHESLSAYWDAELTGELRSSYEYNSAWNRIETALVDTAQPPESYDRTAYDALTAELDNLESRMSKDPDVPALEAYLEAVGTQLGFEAE